MDATFELPIVLLHQLLEQLTEVCLGVAIEVEIDALKSLSETLRAVPCPPDTSCMFESSSATSLDLESVDICGRSNS